jgi:hypothetical protein
VETNIEKKISYNAKGSDLIAGWIYKIRVIRTFSIKEKHDLDRIDVYTPNDSGRSVLQEGKTYFLVLRIPFNSDLENLKLSGHGMVKYLVSGCDETADASNATDISTRLTEVIEKHNAAT